MSGYPENWDEIPEREPLPQRGGGRGPGINGEDLDKIKIKDYIDQPIAVIGFLILPNGFKKTDEDPDEYALVEIMDAAGDCMLFTTTSNTLLGKLELREERNEIPFRTSVLSVESAKRPGMHYYDFA